MLINCNFILVVILMCGGTLSIVNPKRRSIINKSVCDAYILPLNALWETRANCEDHRKFKCRNGYKFLIEVTCDNGRWDSKPECQALVCSPGETFPNFKDQTPNGIFGNDVTINCTDGHGNANGTTGTLTCEKNGNWKVKAECEALVCSLGETFPNFKDQTPNGIFGNDVTINCTDGHGNANGTIGTLTCDTNGNWKVKLECEVQCLSGPEIANGDVENQITSRDVRKEYNFSCDPYFVKNGTGGRVKCNAYGKWETNQTCEDCFLRGKTIISKRTLGATTTKGACQQECYYTTFCTFYRFRRGECFLYSSPILHVSKAATSLDQCIQECKNRKCVTLKVNEYGCYLFDQPLQSILKYFSVESSEQSIIFENTTCPSILQ